MFVLKGIVLILLMLLSEIALAKNSEYVQRCGDTTFLVKSENSLGQVYKVYYRLNEKEEKFLYEASKEHLDVACVKSFAGMEYLLLEETCSGSGCSDFGEYRIIDPSNKKIILNGKPFTAEDEIDVPNDSSKIAEMTRLANHESRNIKEATKILGYTPPLLTLFINKFCCTKENVF